MSLKERMETDAIGRPIDITKIIPKVRPWTEEEAEKARIANKAKSFKKEK